MLAVLGVLFSMPMVAKTWSAHGPGPALITCFLVVVAVLLGPISFVVARAFDTGFVASVSVASDFQVVLILIFGVALFFAWIRPALRGAGSPIPYLPITGWALMGALFCISIVFTHTA